MRCCPKSTRRTRRTPHLVAMQEPGMLKLVTGKNSRWHACVCKPVTGGNAVFMCATHIISLVAILRNCFMYCSYI